MKQIKKFLLNLLCIVTPTLIGLFIYLKTDSLGNTISCIFVEIIFVFTIRDTIISIRKQDEQREKYDNLIKEQEQKGYSLLKKEEHENQYYFSNSKNEITITDIDRNDNPKSQI